MVLILFANVFVSGLCLCLCLCVSVCAVYQQWVWWFEYYLPVWPQVSFYKGGRQPGWDLAHHSTVHNKQHSLAGTSQSTTIQHNTTQRNMQPGWDLSQHNTTQHSLAGTSHSHHIWQLVSCLHLFSLHTCFLGSRHVCLLVCYFVCFFVCQRFFRLAIEDFLFFLTSKIFFFLTPKIFLFLPPNFFLLLAIEDFFFLPPSRKKMHCNSSLITALGNTSQEKTCSFRHCPNYLYLWFPFLGLRAGKISCQPLTCFLCTRGGLCLIPPHFHHNVIHIWHSSILE